MILYLVFLSSDRDLTHPLVSFKQWSDCYEFMSNSDKSLMCVVVRL